MQGEAFVFLNIKQAAHFGHVGWGFRLGDDRYYYGSADHLYRQPWWDLPGWVRYARVAPGGNIDWWAEEGSKTRMLEAMGPGRLPGERYHIWYHFAKQISVPESAPQAALTLARSLAGEGWCVLDNNCLQQAHRVLTAYGAGVPDLSPAPLNWLPKIWFKRIHGEIIRLFP